jgi:hypothetical protein
MNIVVTQLSSRRGMYHTTVRVANLAVVLRLSFLAGVGGREVWPLFYG